MPTAKEKSMHSRPAMIATMAAALLVCIGCGGRSRAPADTPETRAEIARNVARLELEAGSLEQALSLGADLGLDAGTATLEEKIGRELSAAEREAVRRVLHDTLAGIVTADAFSAVVAEAYASQFSAAELESIADFFSSGSGDKLLRAQAQLTAMIGSAVEALVNRNLEQFVASVDQGLAAEFPELETGGSNDGTLDSERRPGHGEPVRSARARAITRPDGSDAADSVWRNRGRDACDRREASGL
jgi:hypothetical protein